MPISWIEEEISYLEDKWGVKSVEAIAKKLNKTKTAILIKAKRLKLGSPYNSGEYINANQTAELLQVQVKTITKTWIGKYGLNGRKRALKELEMWQIKMTDLVKWLKENQDKWDSRKVELYALGAEPDWLQKKRKMDVEIPPNRFQKWSEHDEKLLISWYKNGMTQKEIGQRLRRSENAIQRKVSRLKDRGLLPKKAILPWKDEEETIFLELDMHGISDEQIAWELGRETFHVTDHRRNLRNKGLYPDESKHTLIAKKNIEDMVELKMQGKSYKEIAAEFGIHENTVYRRFKKYVELGG